MKPLNTILIVSLIINILVNLTLHAQTWSGREEFILNTAVFVRGLPDTVDLFVDHAMKKRLSVHPTSSCEYVFSVRKLSGDVVHLFIVRIEEI